MGRKKTSLRVVPPRRSLLVLALAPAVALLAGITIAQANGGGRPDEGARHPSEQAPAVVVPPEFSVPAGITVPGCWIKFFDNEDFRGAPYNYFGPGDTRDLWNFVGRSRSISIGPNARVVLYADEDFQDRVLSLGPGEQIADVAERTQDIRVTFESMKVRCT